MNDPFKFPVCLSCFDKQKHERTYTAVEIMQGCAKEREAITRQLYGVPMEKCCICDGGTIACIYVKEPYPLVAELRMFHHYEAADELLALKKEVLLLKRGRND